MPKTATVIFDVDAYLATGTQPPLNDNQIANSRDARLAVLANKLESGRMNRADYRAAVDAVHAWVAAQRA